MSKYVFFYHGAPDTLGQAAAHQQWIEQWQCWFASIGDALIDGGSSVGMPAMVYSDGHVSIKAGSNPASGYSLIEAENEQQAIAFAKTCPILSVGGSVELAPANDLANA
jgi:hypothetical protein